MSYILDALRKSETERRQGKVPDLGQQVQLIHKPKKQTVSLPFWVGLGLILNALVLIVVFWPAGVSLTGSETGKVSEQQTAPAVVAEPEPEISTVSSPEPMKTGIAQGKPADVKVDPAEPTETSAVAETGEQDNRLRPTIIVPSRNSEPSTYKPVAADEGQRVPHLVELPVSFQKGIPDLIFNSHIYASEPSARRVMINNHYLRAGDTFSGIRVERITEEGVELSKNGRQFRVGVVRDWMSPR